MKRLKENIRRAKRDFLERLRHRMRPFLPEIEKMTAGAGELTEMLKRNRGKTIEISRGLSYGAALVCLVIILCVVPVEKKDIALYMAVMFSSYSLPCWIALGLAYEGYLSLGRRIHEHANSPFASKLVRRTFCLAVISEFCAVSSILWHVTPLALVVFLLSTCIMGLSYIEWIVSVAHWWGDTNHSELTRSSKTDEPPVPLRAETTPTL